MIMHVYDQLYVQCSYDHELFLHRRSTVVSADPPAQFENLWT